MSARAWAFLAIAAGLVVMAIVHAAMHRRPRMVDDPWEHDSEAVREYHKSLRAAFGADTVNDALREINDESARCYPRNWT